MCLLHATRDTDNLHRRDAADMVDETRKEKSNTFSEAKNLLVNLLTLVWHVCGRPVGSLHTVYEIIIIIIINNSDPYFRCVLFVLFFVCRNMSVDWGESEMRRICCYSF